MRTHYEVIGVSMEATPADIRQAWKHAARRTHPDRNPGATADAFVRLSDAYQCLSDPGRRRHYDARLRMEAAASDRQAAPPSSPPPPPPPPEAAPHADDSPRVHARNARARRRRLAKAMRPLRAMIAAGVADLAPSGLGLVWLIYADDPECADLLGTVGRDAGAVLWRQGQLADAATCLRVAAAGLSDPGQRARAMRDLSRVETALQRSSPRARARRAATIASVVGPALVTALALISDWLAR